jgi:hypothetical protein
MRKTILSALVTTSIVSGLAAILPAEAAVQTTTSNHHAVSAPASPVQLATIICGTNGCGTVQTKHQPKRKFQTLGHG